MNRWPKQSRKMKDTAVTVAVVGAACLFVAFMVWAAYESYSQCREDGYSVTACRMMFSGNRTVILESH